MAFLLCKVRTPIPASAQPELVPEVRVSPSVHLQCLLLPVLDKLMIQPVSSRQKRARENRPECVLVSQLSQAVHLTGSALL